VDETVVLTLFKEYFLRGIRIWCLFFGEKRIFKKEVQVG
jgi:hypothetical protein